MLINATSYAKSNALLSFCFDRFNSHSAYSRFSGPLGYILLTSCLALVSIRSAVHNATRPILPASSSTQPPASLHPSINSPSISPVTSGSTTVSPPRHITNPSPGAPCSSSSRITTTRTMRPVSRHVSSTSSRVTCYRTRIKRSSDLPSWLIFCQRRMPHALSPHPITFSSAQEREVVYEARKAWSLTQLT